MHITLLGAGSLALGLLYPWLSRQHGRLSVVTREGDYARALAENRSYRLRIGDHEEVQPCVEVLSYDPGEFDDPRTEACLRLLRVSDVLAVCVGAPHLRDVARLVARSLSGREERPLHLLAFENSPNASKTLREWALRWAESERLDHVPGQVVAHAAIPDRACKRRLDTGEYWVETESFGEIFLQDSAGSLFPPLAASPGLPSVRVLGSGAVELAEMRKFWLVNGTHTALGVLCAEANLQRLSHGLDDENVSMILHELHAEWVRILAAVAHQKGLSEDFSLDALQHHASRLFPRLREMPDFSLRDVLKEFDLLEDPIGQFAAMARLLQKLDDRLGHPVREAFSGNAGQAPFSSLVLAKGVHVTRDHSERHLSPREATL